MAELGVGDLAKRRDEAWAMTVLVADLLQRGIDSGRLAESDRGLLLDLAHAAEQVDAPGRRGRVG